MKPKAIKDLAQLADADLFAAVAEGMRDCASNALNLWRDGQRLVRAKGFQGAAILHFISEEESAKICILMDAVRCPRNQTELFGRQLGYFNQHLAKGLYARAYFGSPSDVREVRRHVDIERAQLFLDGPNDVDWIFRNEILSKREEAAYVDYVAYADTFRSDHFWHRPEPRRLRLWAKFGVPYVTRVGVGLVKAGVCTPKALEIVAETWRLISAPDELTWQMAQQVNWRILQRLSESGILRQQPMRVYSDLLEKWLPPLYQLDLNPLEVSQGELRERQRLGFFYDDWY